MFREDEWDIDLSRFPVPIDGTMLESLAVMERVA